MPDIAWSHNPWSGRRYHVALDPGSVDGYVFWTRRIRPFLPCLDRLHASQQPFVIQYTITGYPRQLEPRVMPWPAAVDDVHRLYRLYGSRVAVWRYDPVLITDLTPAAFHLERFRQLAASLSGATDEVVLSFTQIYRKTRRNIERASAVHGFGWQDPDADAMRQLLGALAAVAIDHGMKPTVCAQPHLTIPPLQAARCIDADRLADIAGRPIRAAEQGNRPGCRCARSRDIGAYDSVPAWLCLLLCGCFGSCCARTDAAP